MRTSYLPLFAAALLFSGNAFAQNTTVANTKLPTIVQSTSTNNNHAIEWPLILERDIQWKKRVWRDIDVRSKENTAFGDPNGKPGSRSLITVLMNGIMTGKIKAYTGTEDRFTTVLTNEEFLSLISAKGATEQITHYRIKEDWLYTKGQMIVRIVGIAPEKEVTEADGTISTKPLFWIYYPDCRDFLAQYYTSGQDNNKAPFNWNEYFESRRFSSKITKVTGDSTHVIPSDK